MALSVLNDKKYDILDDIVEDIHNKCIKMDREEKQALVNRFQRVIEMFLRKMKEVEPLFGVIFNRIGYTGSFFENLRVGEATEYDLNLILKPKNLSLRADKSESQPGFISVIVGDRYESLPRHYKNWCKEIGGRIVLDPNKLSNWLQSTVQKTVDKIEAEGGYTFEDCDIDYVRKSGPAWTLVIRSHEYPMKTIDVDLVPVLEFSCSQWPVSRRMRGSVSRVRDQFEFKAIASYYIKTLFLWEVETQDPNIWKRNRRGRLFIYMLIRWKEALEAEKIPFLWDEKCNLIGHVRSNTLVNFYGKLRGFLKHIDNLIDNQNYDQLRKFISEELSTPSEIKEEQLQEVREPSCTIL